jgi:hypothetical protein
MKRTLTRGIVALLALVSLTPLARADYLSKTFLLDQSNVLPSGTGYGSIFVEAYDGNGTPGGGLSAGQVRLTVQADTLPAYGPVGSNFGVYALGFNSNLTLQSSQISTPSGWQLRNGRFMGGFGQFAWEASGNVYDTHNPLVITISGLGTGATLDNFLIPSTSSTGGVPMNGSVLFAARISGFDINNDLIDAQTQVVGVGAPSPPPPANPGGVGPPIGASSPPPLDNPEPSTLLLCVLGGSGLGLGRWLKRRRTAR